MTPTETRSAHAPTLPARVQVAIVGAGTAGAAAAALLAERGVRVLCLDKAPLDRAGAHWCNGVPLAAFDAAGLDRPTPPESRGAGRFTLVAGWGPTRVELPSDGVADVDMRHLVARLQQHARQHDATLAGGVTVHGLRDGVLQTSAGPVHADTYIDAGGLAGPNLLGRPAPPRDRLCTAAQHVRQVRDPAAAAAWRTRWGVGPDDIVCFTGVAGGFSIVNVRCTDQHMAILTGSLPALGHAAGLPLLQDWVSQHPWVGETLFGGHRAIPLTPPPLPGSPDSLAAGRVLAMGDRAGHVFAPHGSGIGTQLRAARLLADVLAGGGSPHDVVHAWERELHPELRAAYRMMELSIGVDVDTLTALMKAGALDPEVAGHALAQAPGLPPWRGLARAAWGAVKAGGATARLLRTIAFP